MGSLSKALVTFDVDEGDAMPDGATDITPPESAAPVYHLDVDDGIELRAEVAEVAEVERATAEAARASAMAKLEAIGLTPAELAAALGIAP